jgi:hypothetical protein
LIFRDKGQKNEHEKFEKAMKLVRFILFVLSVLVFEAHLSGLVLIDGSTTIDLSSAAGIQWQFKPEGGDWRRITVPAGGWRAQGYTCDAGSYRALIPIPFSAQGQVIRLAFAAVNFGANISVGLDKTHLTMVASHIDGWVPFVADVTSYATPGDPLYVQVDVQGRHKFMVNGKYTVPEGATWYPQLEEGILRGVALQILPQVHMEDVQVQTQLTPDTLNARVTVTNNSSNSAKIGLIAHLSSWNQAPWKYPEIPIATTSIAPNATQVIDLGRIGWALGPASYWWPNVPYRAGYVAQLHLLNIALLIDGQIIENVQQRFGFRQFTVSGNTYELNGIHCNLRGDTQQEANFGTDAYGTHPGFGPPTPDNPGWPQAVDNLLRLNYNVMRIHQIPATPYMLDVSDEMGLMLVEESPLRGSEGGEDYQDGRENMLNMDRELVLRDRNHPSIVIWSAANEWADPVRDAIKVMRTVDDTRPIIADGTGDLGSDIINMEHYVNGFGALPTKGGNPRTDRPYGETEAVWPMDNTRQGFAWMATSIRTRRLKGDADLRNYALNNAWPNYVPGEGPDDEVLELKIKGMSGNTEIHSIITDPWSDPIIRLMQQCYNPVAACDVAFDRLNARSNENGDWPTIKPRLRTGSHVARQIAVFNDEFKDENVTLRWQVRRGTKDGPLVNEGMSDLVIPLGGFRMVDVSFDCPKTIGDLVLILATFKNEQQRFFDDNLVFSLVADNVNLLPDGDYQLANVNSGLFALSNKTPVVQSVARADGTGVWHLHNAGNNDVTLTAPNTDQMLAVEGNITDNGSPAIISVATGKSNQVWHLAEVETDTYLITNKASGKALDVYQRAFNSGARIVQWDANGGENQKWQLILVGK